MRNTWLDISLDSYESHMSQKDIAQAQYLSGFLNKTVLHYKPESLTILGCSGGNGLDRINPEIVKRIICVDINNEFLNAARQRYSEKFKNIEFLCADISGQSFIVEKTDLIFTGLVFEYVDVDITISNVKKCLNKNGKLAVILQLPNENIPEVSPSKYKELEKLNGLFSFVDVDNFIDLCAKENLKLLSNNKCTLESGKEFVELVFNNLQSTQ